ncbi:MAG: NUDIX domain-containing protein [Petrotogaceae bacterium]|jgi:8-oxo-dGTP diphosphatase|nr:NUDIX domain-containing protein [Petrotogaceae bacterium]
MNKEVENYLQKIGLTDDDIKRLVKSEKQKTASMCYAVNEYGEYLFLIREKEPFKSYIVPPGGKTEPGENPAQTCIREYMEETGIRLDVPVLRVITSEDGPENYNWLLFIYTAQIQRQKLVKCDEGRLLWIKNGDVFSNKISDIDRIIFSQYLFLPQISILDITYDINLKVKISLIKNHKN